MAKLFKHHKTGSYCKFQDGSGALITYPHIIELVFNDNPEQTKVWNNIKLNVESSKYDSVEKEFYNFPSGFFNYVIVYNNKQSTGKASVSINGSDTDTNYFSSIVIDNEGMVSAFKREDTWIINGFRNNVVNSGPLFSKEWSKLKEEYPIDKVVNENVIDTNKDWDQLELFRGKYLIVRFIDTNYDSGKQLLTEIVKGNSVDSRK